MRRPAGGRSTEAAAYRDQPYHRHPRRVITTTLVLALATLLFLLTAGSADAKTAPPQKSISGSSNSRNTRSPSSSKKSRVAMEHHAWGEATKEAVEGGSSSSGDIQETNSRSSTRGISRRRIPLLSSLSVSFSSLAKKKGRSRSSSSSSSSSNNAIESSSSNKRPAVFEDAPLTCPTTAAEHLLCVKGGGLSKGMIAAEEEEKRQKASTLVTVKLLFLLFYGSLGSVMPYLPVYYHSLGLPDKQIGQLGAITPAVTFIVAPLWGALADQTGRHKDVLLFTFVFSVISRLLFIWRTTFGWLSFLVFCTAVLNAPVRPLLDSSVLNLLDDKREYGKQRLWGQFGFGLAGCIVGPCLMNHKFGGYKAAFYVHALISIPTLLIMRRFNPTPKLVAGSSASLAAAAVAKKNSKKPKPRFREGLGIVVRNPDALIFFLMVFVIGVSSGIIENFAYKRLREVGGEGTVMGVSRFFSSVTGVPMFWYSGHITKRLSVMGVLILTMCSYILRFFIYASITNPWQGLPAEALRGFTFAAMWASSTYYTHKISPPGMSATMLGFLNGMYGGLGQSTGALIGGNLSQRFGTPKTFVIAGGVDICVMLVFAAYWWFHPNATQIKEDEEEKKK